MCSYKKASQILITKKLLVNESKKVNFILLNNLAIKNHLLLLKVSLLQIIIY